VTVLSGLQVVVGLELRLELLQVKEMDDEDYAYQGLQEPLYRYTAEPIVLVVFNAKSARYLVLFFFREKHEVARAGGIFKFWSF
jgi:hypothetical protein